MLRFFAFVCLLAFSFPAFAVAPGDKIANLTFKDIRYLNRSLDDFPKAKAFALVFLDTGCPVASRYLPTLKKLESDYRSRGVVLIAMFPGAEDSIVGLAAYSVKHEVAFACVKDIDATYATALGVTRTPEVAVLDADRRLRYRGRIDDQYRTGGQRPGATTTDLRDALEAVLAGKEVTPSTTPVDGCPITPPSSPSAKAVNFAEHVAPILQKHCQDCHRPNTVAPFSLIDYAQVSSRAKAIAEVVRDGSMPPWYGAPQHGEFANRRGLSPEERDTLLAWLRSDRPAGDPAKLPPRPVAGPEWRIGEPDLLLATTTHELPEAGDIPYRYAFLPHVFTHDTWVNAVEIKPDNPKVLHHGNLAYVKLGAAPSVENFITGAVPGGEAMTLPPGVAVKIPAGSVLVLQLHYVSTGKPEKSVIRVALRHPRGTVQQKLRLSYVATTRYEIPAGAPAHRVSATRTLPCDAIGVGMFSHMHVRGKDMTFLAHTPDGKTETLLTVPNFNFGWQHAYRWEFGSKKLPKGTRLECVSHYDNSAFNPYNPDASKAVHDGQQSYDEMLNGFVFYVDANEKLNLKVDAKTGKELAAPPG